MTVPTETNITDKTVINHHTKRPRGEDIEDRVSTYFIILICVLFLGYVIFLSLPRKQDGTSSNPIQVQSSVPFIRSDYKCNIHDNNPEACVKAQTSGKGCSWYASCRKCIVGSHDGKTYEEICGQPR